ncbi:MAG: hypothetical protein R2942_09315 [Ignavibacteria bacterium]
MIKSYDPGSWFKLDPKVNSLWVRRIDNDNIPDADILVATAWRTADCSEKLDKSKGENIISFSIMKHGTGMLKMSIKHGRCLLKK